MPTFPHKMTFVFVCDCVFREFVRTAWADIERFKEQKNKDLREALISYAIMQISMCKKVFSYVCFLFSTVYICSCILAYLKMPGFVKLILSSVQFFQKNKLPRYCCMSLRIALVFSLSPSLSQGIQVWSNAKECFNKMWATFQPNPLSHIVQSETISWSLNCSFMEMAMGAQILPSLYAESKLLRMIRFPFFGFSHVHTHTYTLTNSQKFPSQSHSVDQFLLNPSVLAVILSWHSAKVTWYYTWSKFSVLFLYLLHSWPVQKENPALIMCDSSTVWIAAHCITVVTHSCELCLTLKTRSIYSWEAAHFSQWDDCWVTCLREIQTALPSFNFRYSTYILGFHTKTAISFLMIIFQKEAKNGKKMLHLSQIALVTGIKLVLVFGLICHF